MAAIEWEDIFGQKFEGDESREASDFSEILYNHGLDIDMAFKMFRDQELTIGRRMYFSVKASEDDIAFMLMRETDPRLCEIIKKRLADARLEESGGIILV